MVSHNNMHLALSDNGNFPTVPTARPSMHIMELLLYKKLNAFRLQQELPDSC